MYLGFFYFDSKEVFLLLGAFLLGLAMVFNWDVAWFHKTDLLTLLIVILVTKGLLPAIHNEAFFILAIMAIFLTIYFSIFQVLLFYFLSFLLFRLFKVI